MKRYWLCCLLVPIFFVSSVILHGEEHNTTEFLFDFIQGTYSVIGRLPDSPRLYSGIINLKRQDGQFQVTRRIDGETRTGNAKLELATADRVNVLRARFKIDGIEYEATYLISADLDNYARLSGYVYKTDRSTRTAGFETLFRTGLKASAKSPGAFPLAIDISGITRATKSDKLQCIPDCSSIIRSSP